MRPKSTHRTSNEMELIYWQLTTLNLCCVNFNAKLELNVCRLENINYSNYQMRLNMPLA